MQPDYLVYSAGENDQTSIIQLFETCLGTDGGTPSQAFWRWKHIENPFGVSPVLLAKDASGILVGLRAFMCWNWRFNNEIFRSYRAVDTATHPKFQGKGIFKKLTLQIWNEVQQSNPNSFVFNTPNSQSKPGYLKMGWQVLGKPSAAFFLFPFVGRYQKQIESDTATLTNFDFSQISLRTDSVKICTDVSAAYYHWRYLAIPDRSYLGWIYEGKQFGCLFVFYLRKRKFFVELRVSDCITLHGKPSRSNQTAAFRALARRYAGYIVTTLWNHPSGSSKVIQKFIPEVTLRLPYIKSGIPANIEHLGGWQFDMGTLELF